MFKSPIELIVLVLLIAVVSLLTMRFQDKTVTNDSYGNSQPIIQVLPSPVMGGGDDRYTMAPRPQRVWNAGPDMPAPGSVQSMLEPIPTRGYPEAYQQMGVITGGDGKVLPLYGRRTAP